MASAKRKKANKSNPNLWTAHFCVADHMDNTVDVFITIDTETKENWNKANVKEFNFEAGCCGQNQCAVCSRTMVSADLVDIRPGEFPFHQVGDLHEQLLKQINMCLEKDDEKDDEKKKPTQPHLFTRSLRISEKDRIGVQEAIEKDFDERMKKMRQLMSQPLSKRQTISSKDVQDTFKILNNTPSLTTCLASSSASSSSTN
jgi:hypothetical protein